jgi:superfamily II DNA or RNA helicase
MTKKADIWVHDEVYAHIKGLQPQDRQFLWNKFGIEVEGSFYMPARRTGRWDGKLRFFDKEDRIFIRLLDELIPYLDKWGYEVELHDERKPVQLIKSRITEDYFIKDPDQPIKVKLRPYQVHAINKAMDSTYGILEMATGSGKSLTIAGICALFTENDKRCMVIVPSADLVGQTSASYQLVGIPHGTYSGSAKDLSQPHVVATWQALQNNPSIVKDFDCIIIDETHGATAEVVGKLICDHAKHVPYRFGFTGTMPKKQTDLYTLRGSIGEVLYQISAAELIQMGYLADLEITPVEVQADVDEEFPDYGSEKTYLASNTERLDLLADFIVNTCEKHGNTLVLVNSIKQGRKLEKLIKDSVFLCGATENEVRAEWYSTFADRDDLIVIATAGIASTGISIDRIFALVMIDSGKSFIRCIQSIGRAIRKNGDKVRAAVYDIYSSLKWSKKHARERQKFYKEAKYPLNKVAKVKA